ncbi:MAG: hypothetical protein Q8M19_14170 [Reyranella sp.]|nr:hypothetical protein [Reyranella sp.]
MAWNNLLNFLAGGTVGKEQRDTATSYERVRTLQTASPYAEDKRREFVIDLLIEACGRAEVVPIGALVEALGFVIDDLLDFDSLIFGLPEVRHLDGLTTDEAVALRTLLARKERFLRDHERQLDIWREKVIRILAGLLSYLPSTAFKERWDDSDPDEGVPGATVPLIELLETPAETLDRLIITFHDDDVTKADLFTSLREQFERRVCIASDIRWDERFITRRKAIYPSMANGAVPAQLAELYLQGTPWLRFFLTPLPFAIPFPARFEHTHIVGGSGHGKTQLLQLQIVRDLIESAADGRSIVVMDSQGDLLKTISSLSFLAPDDPSGLADRVMIIDPTDVEFPVALNMFDFNREGVAELPLVDRERILNGTIELYEYFFGALLGAELTARQGIIFKYLARLLLEIPGATVHTFRQLMEDGEPFRPYMEKLPPTARAFFETRFFDRSFNETKKQVLTRLWGVLSNATFDRMFSHPQSKVDMFSALQEGKIIFINTAKDLLKDEGASILGRFFIALIAQAAMRRATVPAHERRPCFVYIDEAADYFDDRMGSLLNQARKYKVGMTLAHQNLDQLSSSLRASFFSSTSIKFAGGVSNKDAAAFAAEMHSDAEFIQAQRKRKNSTSFACYVRNITPQALGISVPLGVVEQLPTMDRQDQQLLQDLNRAQYCVPLHLVPVPLPPPQSEKPKKQQPKKAEPPEPIPSSAPDQPPIIVPSQAEAPSLHPAIIEPPAVETAPKAVPPRKAMAAFAAPPPLGRGGKEHKYLQTLIKEFAISKGYHAVIEEQILDGAGRVDVSLTKDALRIACEISVTTGRDYELGNIEKCLAAGYAHVLFVSGDARHVKAMEKLAGGQFEDDERGKIHFVSPEEGLALLEGWTGTAVATTVRGYKVRTTTAVIDPEEAVRRRSAVALVIAGSLRGVRREDQAGV